MATASDRTTFTVSVKGEQTGEDFKGAFTIKTRLSHRDQLLRDQFRREILGPTPVGTDPSPRARNQAEVFSEIWVHLISAPDWWKSADNGLNLVDDVVVGEVYQGIAKAKADYFDSLKKAAEAAQADLKQTEVK